MMCVRVATCANAGLKAGQPTHDFLIPPAASLSRRLSLYRMQVAQPPNTAFYMFSQQIKVLNFLDITVFSSKKCRALHKGIFFGSRSTQTYIKGALKFNCPALWLKSLSNIKTFSIPYILQKSRKPLQIACTIQVPGNKQTVIIMTQMGV
jgi:hypothetical protein